MISRTAYNLARQGMSMIMDRLAGTMDEPNQHEAKIIWDWTHPYVVVIHRTSGRGYYLNRTYRHIVSVDNIQLPEHTVEINLNHQASSTNTPEWATKIEECCTCNDSIFDSYWLY